MFDETEEGKSKLFIILSIGRLSILIKKSLLIENRNGF